ncbi:Carbamate kinase 2 [Phaeobacter sp. CECT 5382]|uniref:carbamate kinase n=1 Tax=Phaeobacter sp. CECT 5382 TaxID=1712645 RepID=UPI0006DB6E6B|nr:carbamate kinase [Phaeobacter sp. CECT 5382]CUH87171.1 Carbamate kinase 2 [Phaeobacter sp. CECT 5382]
MRIVVALGGNALLRRGQELSAQNQRENIRIAASVLSPLAEDNDLVVTHGNGPQVGLLALQEAAYTDVEEYPLDVLVGETMGMIGYMIEQEMGNLLPVEKPLSTILTMVEVDPKDPAFADPTKFIGPVYSESEARENAQQKGWAIKPDGDKWRRVVPSPAPKRIFQVRPIRWLLDHGSVVIAAGGGGIPPKYSEDGKLEGVECVIDKDHCSSMLAQEINADVFVVATEAEAVFLDWNTPKQRGIRSASPDALDQFEFPAGSMGPKVQSAQDFARATGAKAVICALADIPAALRGEKGTTIDPNAKSISFHD